LLYYTLYILASDWSKIVNQPGFYNEGSTKSIFQLWSLQHATYPTEDGKTGSRNRI